MQLTGTNRSIGLIALIFSVHGFESIETHRLKTEDLSQNATQSSQAQPENGARSLKAISRLLRCLVLRRPGGSSEEPQPDPIPNSAVKLFSANGTMA